MPLLSRLSAAATLSLALLPLLATPGLAAPKVVASIKPVHSLVAAVMEGVGEPELIVEGAGSPHGYALKPSQAQALADADLIFWIGHELETFLEKPIETIGANAQAVELMDTDGLFTLPMREGGAFEPHMHDDHDAGHADGEAKDHAEADAHEDHDHEHGAFDPHVWLDPMNAKVFVTAITEALSAKDPAHASDYAANAAREMTRLDALMRETETELAPVKGKHFIVFHDGYQYFEHRFGMEASGSITVNPEVKPSAERLAEIRNKVQGLGAVCAFSEPQFESKLVSVAIEGSNAKTGVLDPLGAELKDGPDLYFELIRGLATSMKACLEGQ